MTSTTQVTISVAGEKEVAELVLDNRAPSITFRMKNGFTKTYSDSDFYRCFGQIREDNSNITFFCKGSKINVHPSSMSSQMTLGLKAYELTLGKSPSLTDIVFIFDYDDYDLTNNPEAQRAFYRQWIESEKTS